MRSTAWSSRCRKASTKGFVRGGCGFCALKQEQRPRLIPAGAVFVCASQPPPVSPDLIRGLLADPQASRWCGARRAPQPRSDHPTLWRGQKRVDPGSSPGIRGGGVYGVSYISCNASKRHGEWALRSGRRIRRFECVTTPLTLFAFPRLDRGIQGRLAEAGVGCP